VLFTDQTVSGRDEAAIAGKPFSSLVDAIVFLRYVEIGGETDRVLSAIKSRGSCRHLGGLCAHTAAADENLPADIVRKRRAEEQYRSGSFLGCAGPPQRPTLASTHAGTPTGMCFAWISMFASGWLSPCVSLVPIKPNAIEFTATLYRPHSLDKVLVSPMIPALPPMPFTELMLTTLRITRRPSPIRFAWSGSRRANSV
jgi:hypothetical protein